MRGKKGDAAMIGRVCRRKGKGLRPHYMMKALRTQEGEATSRSCLLSHPTLGMRQRSSGLPIRKEVARRMCLLWAVRRAIQDDEFGHDRPFPLPD